MLYFLLLLLIAFAFLLMHILVKRYGFDRVEYSLRFSENEVTEGDTVTLIETVCSRKALPLPWLKVEMTTDAALEFAQMQSAVSGSARFISSFFSLRPYHRIQRHWQVRCTKRGVFAVSHVILVISDLFGTIEQSMALPDVSATLTVLPKAVDFSFTAGDPRSLIGDTQLRRSLMPDRMAMGGLRPYADGDPVRDICYSASARSIEPMVYRFCDTTQPTVTILLNMATKEYDRDLVTDAAALEKEIKLCAALLLQLRDLRIPVRLCANTRMDGQLLDTPAASGDAHIHHLLQLLAAVPDTIDERFINLVSRVCHRDPTALLWAVTAHIDDALLRLADDEPRLQMITVRHLHYTACRANLHSAADVFSTE
ncbi:MAG: DUF58 domain-containing protein [Oscillospiraceae bacterium]|nr:DUF58 domain-containing protein [Oscillospiraceae bacterium]